MAYRKTASWPTKTASWPTPFFVGQLTTLELEIGLRQNWFFYRRKKLRGKFRLPPTELAGGQKENQRNIHDTSSKLAVRLLFS